MLVAGAAAMFGTLSYISNRANDLGIDPLAFVAWRGVVGTIAVLALAQLAVLRVTRGGIRAPGWRPASRGRALIVACLLGAFVNIAIFEAFQRTTIAVALICFYTFPAVVMLAAVRAYGERLTALRAGALVLSTVGLGLAVLSPAFDGGSLTVEPIGVGLALAASLCQASFILIAGRGFAPLPAVRTAAYSIFATGSVALILAIASGDLAGLAVPLHEPQAWIWVLAGGIWGAAIPTTALLAGIGLIGPSRAAILMTIEPLVGITVASLLLQQHPGPLQIFGGGAVLAAAIILQLVPIHLPSEPEFGALV